MTNRTHLPRSQRMIAASFLSLLLPALAAGSEYFVANSGSNGNDGRAADRPFQTIARAVTAAVAGDTITVRGGTYREELTFSKAGTATQPIVVRAYGGERPVLKGSRQVTGWSHHGGAIWKKTGWTINSQQVFDDGARLQQIGPAPSHYSGNASDGSWMYRADGSGLGSLRAGSFYLDRGANTLYVWLADGSDPNRSLLEASTARRIVYCDANARHIHFRNLSFRHCNNSASIQIGAAIELSNDCRMEDCDVQWCDFSGIGLGYGRSNTQLIRCVSSNNGDMGINVDRHTNFLLKDCVMEYNNYRGFNAMWAAGGVKITSNSWGTVEGCTARNNRGPGIWFDYCNSGGALVARGNTLIGNWDKSGGLISECSKNVLFANNLVVNNDRRGIYISASSNVRVCNNTLVGNRGFAALEVGGMPRSGRTLDNVRVYNNIVCDNSAQHDLRITRENGGDITNLAIDNNCFQRTVGALVLWHGADSRGGYAGTTSSTLAAWRAATAFDDNGVQGVPGFVSAAGGNYRLSSTALAVNRGRSLAEVPSDLSGTARPQGGTYDVGAYEYTGAVAVPAPTPDPTPVTGTAMRFNFQPSGSALHSGYLKDDGAAYGARNGRTYGWTSTNTANARERNAANSPDQRYDTSIYMNVDGSRNWEVAVPNGRYEVTVVCGDPQWFNGIYKVAVEGVLTVDGTPTNTAPWKRGTTTVNVADGRLTLSSAAGAYQNRLCFVDIAPVL